MFERYTEKARRVIFFARYEASQFGSPYIETEHLLLGVLREDKALANRFLHSFSSVESIRKQIEAHTEIREKTSSSVDLPLSDECKRILAYTAEEAERLGHKHIGSEHLLLGLLREEKSFAAEILKERRVKLDAVRKDLEQMPEPPAPRSGAVTGSRAAAAPGSLSDFARDLTQAAAEGQLEPLIGREQEVGAVIEILCRHRHRSALLIGERGSGKSAIVEGLAQRIVDGSAPPVLLDNRMMAMDAEVVAGWALNGLYAEERLNQTIKALSDTGNTILYIDALDQLIGAAATSGSAVASGVLKHWLLRGKLVCVAACTPGEFTELTKSAPWIRECFAEVHIRPLDETTTRQVLESRKKHYEPFHGVTYAGDALDLAVSASAGYLPHKPLPGKALELLDAAGARVKQRQAALPELPEEIAESVKRVKFITHRMESAIQNHEFEKAKFYSEEERKERENLRALREKHDLDVVPLAVVTRKDVEEVIAQWASYPFQP